MPTKLIDPQVPKAAYGHMSTVIDSYLQGNDGGNNSCRFVWDFKYLMCIYLYVYVACVLNITNPRELELLTYIPAIVN